MTTNIDKMLTDHFKLKHYTCLKCDGELEELSREQWPDYIVEVLGSRAMFCTECREKFVYIPTDDDFDKHES